MSLDREAVVGAALGILDEYGLADLSMRRVAEALGVKAGALYWHVPNKQGLLAAVADRLLTGLEMPAGTPREALEGWASELRLLLLAHRDSAELVATALASGLCTVDPLEPVRAILAAGGPGEQAGWGARALLHLVLGHLVAEQNAQLFRRLVGDEGSAAAPSEGSGRDDGDEAFAHGVRALVAGLLDHSE